MNHYIDNASLFVTKIVNLVHALMFLILLIFSVEYALKVEVVHLNVPLVLLDILLMELFVLFVLPNVRNAQM